MSLADLHLGDEAAAGGHARRVDRMRRALDIAGAAAGLALLSPLLVGVAVAIRLDSRGPALFRQTRVGRDGKPFTILKFRSMRADAARLPAVPSDRAGICGKWRDDPRVTRVGRFIRRTSIDELPQLINVLKGDMALVGPRPSLPSEVAAYPVRARRRLAVRPGITGLWQVSGRADLSFDKMIDLDLAYVDHRSVAIDLALIALTARAVFGRSGAY